MRYSEPIAHLIPEIQDLFERKDFVMLKELLRDIRPEDLSESWHRLSDDEITGIFKLLDPKPALVLFESLDLTDQQFLIQSLDSSNITSLLEGIPPSDVAELFQILPGKVVKRMVSLVKKKDAIKRIELLMNFEPDTAGSLLQPEFIKLLICGNNVRNAHIF